MFLKPFTRFFPGEEPTAEPSTSEEYNVAGFTVKLEGGKKTYIRGRGEDAEVRQVETLSEVVARFRAARPKDPNLDKTWGKFSAWATDHIAGGDKMMEMFAKDCFEIGEKAYNLVLSEPYEAPPEPPPPPKLNLFGGKS